MGEPNRPPTRRRALADATQRANNIPQFEMLKQQGGTGENMVPHSHPPSDYLHQHGSPICETAVNPRLSAIEKEHYTHSKRNSQVSTTSTSSTGKKIKKHIGPWKLGKTLGKGSTARVRLAVHTYTGQKAAVKIVEKQQAQTLVAGSLMHLDRAESQLPEVVDGLRRMPVGIEREVAIMKLIQHPHIMKLYDIWENRTEIYLVLEYVDNGELFEEIASRGHLDEKTAVMYFRQIISGIGYCHEFNICHRDLKPENILLTSDYQIKIADFGMAALQQGPTKKLETSCGSPHYAAPEVISGSSYVGAKIDVWSLGVILYASMAGRLPFDVDQTGEEEPFQTLLNKIKLGRYEMPSQFSSDAQNLIHRMLQLKPEKRIDLKKIWEHPLLRKYDFLDNLRPTNHPQSGSTNESGNFTIRRSQIDKELFRSLRSMWHTMSENDLLAALTSPKANDQKRFYGLLLKYRDSQLENYRLDTEDSMSDYHHVRPSGMTRTYSTTHFPQTSLRGQGRQTSRYTVISNSAESEKSYDPYRASRPRHMNIPLQNQQVKVTVHGSRVDAETSMYHFPPPRAFGTRSSLASSTKSRGSTVRANIGHKRNVSFNHNLKIPGDNSQKTSMEALPSTNYIRSKKPPQPENMPQHPKRGLGSLMWKDDVRKLSNSLAQDCDKAFNTTSNSERKDSQRQSKLFAPSNASPIDRPLPPDPPSESVKPELLEARRRAELRRKYNESGSPSHLDRVVDHIGRLEHRLNQQSSLPGPEVEGERRILSAPAAPRAVPSTRPLRSIPESSRGKKPSNKTQEYPSLLNDHEKYEAKNGRIASAPEPRGGLARGWAEVAEPHSQGMETIRMVDQSIMEGAVQAPFSLNLQNNSSQAAGPPLMSGGLGRNHPYTLAEYQAFGAEPRQRRHAGVKRGMDSNLGRIEEDDILSNGMGDTVRGKKSTSWFKRSSKSSDEDYSPSNGGDTLRSHTPSTGILEPYERPHNPHLNEPQVEILNPQPAKKKGFGLGRFFKKSNDKPSFVLYEADQGLYDETASVDFSIIDDRNRLYPNSGHSNEDLGHRQIAPQQSWLGKLFNVKPQPQYICFGIPRQKARRQITTLLKEWRQYGIKEIQVDRERNIVFGTVKVENHLNMKPVSFAVEFLTMLDHDNRRPISVARFTLERGAMSSLQKVIESLIGVLDTRRILVKDKLACARMIQTVRNAETKGIVIPKGPPFSHAAVERRAHYHRDTR